MNRRSKISNRKGNMAERKILSPNLLRFVLVSCLLSLISCLSAQVSATFKSDSTKVEIGDHLVMKLVINAQPGTEVILPKFDADSIGPNLEIIKRDTVDKAALGGDTIYSQNIIMSAYEQGRYFLSPLKIYFRNKTTGVVDSAYTNDWQLTVTAPAVDTTKPIKSIKAPLKVVYKLNEFTWWIVAGILLLAAIIAFILYRRYKKKPAPVVTRPRPKEPAHIWANKELKKLEQEKLWQTDQVKQYHSRLTDILRSYLEYRFGYYAMEATTEEIITEVNKREIGMDASARLRDTLRLADFVKFAKMSPAPDQNTKSIQDAFAFVEMTKPKIEETNNINNKK
jgi:hypothetical protein